MKEIDIKKFLRIDPDETTPYQIPVFPNMVKLDANESPYEISAKLLEEVQIHLNRYPDPSYGELRQILAQKWGWDQILLGNGSDELIQNIIVTFGGAGKTVFIPTPSFAMYKVIAGALGEKVAEIPLGENFDLVLSDDWRSRMYDSRQSGNIIFLAIPNNPTGNSFSRSVVEEIVENFHGIVCLDEAYADFAGSDTQASQKQTSLFLDLLPSHPNLIILRTLSKIGLAGIRLGFLLANEAVIQNIQRVKLPYNINILSEAVARVVLSKKEVIETNIRRVKQNRDWLYEQMKRIKGIRVYPSCANFILFQVQTKAQGVFEQLLGEGILVRYFGQQGRLQGHFRVTVGRREECSLFLEKLKKILSNDDKQL